MTDCERCFQLGHRCAGTHTDSEGKPTCVFCLDEVPCPVTQKQPPKPTRKVAMPAPAAKRCKAPVDKKDPNSPPCGTALRNSNRSGYCHMHSHYQYQVNPPITKDAFPDPQPRNHRPAPAKRSNGNGHQSPIMVPVSEELITNLFLKLPAQDRATMVFGWLASNQ